MGVQRAEPSESGDACRDWAGKGILAHIPDHARECKRTNRVGHEQSRACTAKSLSHRRDSGKAWTAHMTILIAVSAEIVDGIVPLKRFSARSLCHNVASPIGRSSARRQRGPRGVQADQPSERRDVSQDRTSEAVLTQVPDDKHACGGMEGATHAQSRVLIVKHAPHPR